MNKTRLLIIGSVAILLAAGVVQFSFPHKVASPSVDIYKPSTVDMDKPASLDVENVSVIPTSHPAQTPFAVDPRDSIASWDFKGAYTGNPELMAKAQAEIKRLSDLLVTATSSAMILSVGIANQYELLGDGKKQYEYLERAIRTNPENGLPWHNLGVLMERLGALKTAKIAYEKASLLQPQLAVYQYAYIEFLIDNMKDDKADIEKAFTWAKKNIGRVTYLTELRAKWEAL